MQGGVEAGDLGRGEVLRGLFRMDGGLVKNLVAVTVALTLVLYGR